MRLLDPSRARGSYLALGLVLSAGLVFAQSPGWRSVDEPTPKGYGDPATPVARDLDPQNFDQPAAGAASRLTIPAGKFITVRVNQPLSSDHNQVGDFFTATLADPIVVDGVVIAQRGQTVSGRVSEVQKAGRVSGLSRLGVQLTELTAVDGQQLPIQTQLIGRNGHSTEGRDVAAVATTTGLGAAIGAASTWDAGRGAAIGAGIGAAAGLAGVLLTRGAPAVVPPETLLSFRIEAPVSVSTDRAPQLFRYVDPNEYRDQPVLQTQAGPPPPAGAPAPYPYYGPAPYPYAYPYPYYAPYPYWGPGFGVGVVIGPHYHYRGGYYRYHR